MLPELRCERFSRFRDVFAFRVQILAFPAPAPAPAPATASSLCLPLSLSLSFLIWVGLLLQFAPLCLAGFLRLLHNYVCACACACLCPRLYKLHSYLNYLQNATKIFYRDISVQLFISIFVFVLVWPVTVFRLHVQLANPILWLLSLTRSY